MLYYHTEADMTKSYLAQFKRGTIVPVFSQFELKQKKEQMLKRKDQICEQFYKSVATTIMVAML